MEGTEAMVMVRRKLNPTCYLGWVSSVTAVIKYDIKYHEKVPMAARGYH